MSLGVDSASVAGNHKIDWSAAKAAGVSFAILRVSEGTSLDSQFEAELLRARSAGLVVGAYAFLHLERDDIEHQVERALHALVAWDGPLVLPPTLDLETRGLWRRYGITHEQALERCYRAWHMTRTIVGVAPILYTSAGWWRDELGDAPLVGRRADMLESPLWLAGYWHAQGQAPQPYPTGHAPAVPAPWRSHAGCWIHQYQGNVIRMPGFDGAVDLNRLTTIGASEQSPEHASWINRRLGAKPMPAIDGAAVRAFQAERGLAVDGVIGPRTFAALCWSHPSPFTP